MIVFPPFLPSTFRNFNLSMVPVHRTTNATVVRGAAEQ